MRGSDADAFIVTPVVCRGEVRNMQDSLFLNINQLVALNFIISLFQASTCFEHMCSSSGGQIVLYSLWYHHTETSEWSKITKIIKIIKLQFYKYEHMVVQFMCEFFVLL